MIASDLTLVEAVELERHKSRKIHDRPRRKTPSTYSAWLPTSGLCYFPVDDALA